MHASAVLGACRAGHGEDFAVLFESVSRGNERPTLERGFDDDRAQRHPCENTIAPRKVSGAWGLGRREFRKDSTVFGDLLGEAAVLARVNISQAGAEDRDGSPLLL